jgi:hypothetical protein
MIDMADDAFLKAFLETEDKVRREMEQWPQEIRDQARRTAVLEFPRSSVQSSSDSNNKTLGSRK